MPSQPTLRPFDVAVALRLRLEPESRYEPLAEALVTSTSAVHRSVARLGLAGICRPGSRTVSHDALYEFLLHGLRYAFPPMIGAERTGMPTGMGHPALRGSGEGRALVWASEQGSARGAAIAPLFAGVPAVAARDPRMHELLALADAARVATPDEREVVAGLLRARLSDTL